MGMHFGVFSSWNNLAILEPTLIVKLSEALRKIKENPTRQENAHMVREHANNHANQVLVMAGGRIARAVESIMQLVPELYSPMLSDTWSALGRCTYPCKLVV